MATCSGPAIDENGRRTRCQNEARAEGLCPTHYRQAVRCRKRGEDVLLKPIRTEPGVRLPGLTVSQRAGAALKKRGPSLYEAARAVIEAWAKRRERG